MLEKFVAYTMAPIEPQMRETIYRHWSTTSCGRSCLYAGVVLAASIWLFLVLIVGIAFLGVFN